jgi:hypothetical protein
MMSDKPNFSVSFPDLPFFLSSDPNAVDVNGRKPDVIYHDPFEGLYHLLSKKPHFRPPPRRKPEEPKPEEPGPGPEAKPDQK